MQRKDFLRNSIGVFGLTSVIPVIDGCKKDSTTATTTTGSTSGSCTVTPTEEEGAFPYPGGELTNALQRVDITGGQNSMPGLQDTLGKSIPFATHQFEVI